MYSAHTAARRPPERKDTNVIWDAEWLVLAVLSRVGDHHRQLAHLEERLKLRPVVFTAIERLKAERKIDDEGAYAILRNCAMRRRLPVEQIAAFFLVGSETLYEVG